MVRIRFYGKLEERYNDLAVGRGEAKHLHMLIAKAIEKIKENPHKGKVIPKPQIPFKYKQLGITTLRRMNLDERWRLIYTLDGSDIEIVAVLLEWKDHPEYNREFGYD